MRKFRPLYIYRPGVRLKDLQVLELRFNRHLPELDQVAEHQHRFTQLLLYLSGRGTLYISGVPYPIGPGELAVLPPLTKHWFQEGSGRRPLCLVIHLKGKEGPQEIFPPRRLPARQLAEVRHWLAEMRQHEDQPGISGQLRVCLAVLHILELLLDKSIRNASKAGILRQVERWLEQHQEDGFSRQAMADALSLNADYLNRLVKKHSGMSLSQYEDRWRLARTLQLLRQSSSVRDIALRLGFVDQNYFARWFRQQTGMSPTVWRSRHT